MSEVDPAKLRSEFKPSFAIAERVSEHVFKELGWLEKLDFGTIDISSIDLSDLTAVKSSLDTFTSTISSLFPDIVISDFKGDISSIITNNAEQFQGAFIENLENRIGVELPKTLKQQIQLQSPAKNLKESLNPLGIKNSGMLSLLSRFIAENSTNSQDETKATREAIEALFLNIWNINSALATALAGYDTQLDALLYTVLQNNRANVTALYNALKSLVRVFDDYYGVLQEPSLYGQMVSIKKILFDIEKYYRISLVVDENVIVLSDLISNLISVRDNMSILMTHEKKLLTTVEADYRELHPSITNIDELGSVEYYLNETFLISDDDFNIIHSKFYEHLRDSYKISGHSSVNMAATDFIKKVKSRTDVIAEVDGSVPRTHRLAPKVTGSGDLIAADSRIESLDTKKKIGPLTEELVDKLFEKIAKGRSYSTKGENGNLGKYGFDAQILISHGYVKTGTGTKNLKNDKNWDDRSGGDPKIESRDDFLAATDVQDKILELELKIIYKGQLKNNILTTSSKPNIVAAAIATEFLFGAQAVKDIQKDLDYMDGNGVVSKSFYNEVKGAISDKVPSTEASKAIADLGGSESDQLIAISSSQGIQDSPGITFPNSPGASSYPHNNVTETESGHLSEKDDTPGFERINERHRTGTGYEILADGTRKVMVVGDNYRAVLGDDYLLVTGNVNISVFGDVSIDSTGDIDISASNDINISSGGDLNLDIKGGINETAQGDKTTTVKGNMTNSVSGYTSMTGDGDTQIEGASVSVVARDTIVDVQSPEDFRVKTNDISMVAAGDVAFGGQGNIALKGEAVEVASSTFKVDSSSGVELLAGGGTVNARVSQAVQSAFTGSLTPINSHIASAQALLDTLNESSSSDFIKNIQEFEAIDTSVNQAQANDETKTIKYHTTTAI